MGSESKGRAWFSKLYNKLERILVEVDTFTSQSTLCLNSSDPSGWESVRGDPDQFKLALPRCESPSHPPSHQNFDRVEEEQVEEDITTLKISIDRSNLIPTETKSSDAPVEDSVANMRSSNEDNSDDVTNGKSDAAAPVDTKALSGIAFGEDPSYVDDNELYALHARTKKLRSLQRKILDALSTKRIREKEYEQLPIWFGDANMGSDLVTEDSEHKESIDSKSSQALESEDSQWELL